MGRLGAPLLLVCSSLSPEASGEIERIAADLHDLGELAAEFDLRVGYEALAWGRHINDYRQAWAAVERAAHAAGRRDPRQLPHAGAAPADRRDGEDPWRAHRAGPGRRRARHRDGPALPQPPLPLLPGPGRPAGRLDAPGARRHGLRRLAQPRDLQRRLPRGLDAAHRDRRHALVPLARRAAEPRRGAAARDRRRRVHRVRRRRQPPKRRPRPRAARPRLPPHAPPPLEAGRALPPGRGQPRGQPRGRGLLPFLLSSTRARGRRDRAARRRCQGHGGARQDDAGEPVRRPDRQGRAQDPGGARRRRQPALPHRPAGPARRVLRRRLRAR